MQKIHVLGPEFSYSYNLAAKITNKKNIICEKTIEDVFVAVKKSKNSSGLVPMENMLNGTVRETLFGLEKYALHIERAYDFKIENILAARSKNFKKIASHPQPLAQCRAFLKGKKVEIFETSSTSRAMEMAAKNPDVAAIGNAEAAQFYGVPVVRENISNQKNNLTRFLLVGNGGRKYSVKGQKTSMIIAPREDHPGLLFEILSVFEIKKINLTKIESIPTGKKMNDYIFYIDIDGALEEERVKSAVEFLRTFVRVELFGSYETLGV